MLTQSWVVGSPSPTGFWEAQSPNSANKRGAGNGAPGGEVAEQSPVLVAQGQGSAHVWCLELLAALSVSEQGAPARASPVAAVPAGALAPFGALPAAPSCWVPS